MLKISVLLASVMFFSTTLVQEVRADRLFAKQVKGCSRLVTVGSGFVYKNSAPVRASSAINSRIVGFRREPTLISKGPRLLRSVTVLDSEGNKIGRCPWSSAHDFRGGRYRCTMQTSALRRLALKNTKNPRIYFPITGKTCVEIPDAGACYGSVKGLCSQILK